MSSWPGGTRRTPSQVPSMTLSLSPTSSMMPCTWWDWRAQDPGISSARVCLWRAPEASGKALCPRAEWGLWRPAAWWSWFLFCQVFHILYVESTMDFQGRAILEGVSKPTTTSVPSQKWLVLSQKWILEDPMKLKRAPSLVSARTGGTLPGLLRMDIAKCPDHQRERSERWTPSCWRPLHWHSTPGFPPRRPSSWPPWGPSTAKGLSPEFAIHKRQLNADNHKFLLLGPRPLIPQEDS